MTRARDVPTKDTEPPSPAARPRAAAMAVLAAVLDKGHGLDVAIEIGEVRALEPRDRAFAGRLADLALRHLGEIDALTAHHLHRPLPEGAKRPRHALRIGAAQLLFTEVPAHAAVGETVDTLTGRDQRFRGVVNSVLRRISETGLGPLGAYDAGEVNTPDWLWRSWCKAYGAETAGRIAAAHLSPPPLDLGVKADAAGWAERLGAHLLPGGTLRLDDPAAVSELPGYDEGAWWVQDAAAALPVRLLGQLKGLRVADLCAAPGGKTAQLAAAGARVTAVDRSEKRLERLRDNLARLGLEAECVAADVVAWRPAEPFDAVLLDAPCSSTGTVRRHPDVAHLKTPADVTRLAALQDRLLAAAADMVRPAGRLVYCTCSLQPAEGELRVAAFLDRHAGWRRLPVDAVAIGAPAEAIAAPGDLRTLPCQWPEEGGLAGFYAALLVRDG